MRSEYVYSDASYLGILNEPGTKSLCGVIVIMVGWRFFTCGWLEGRWSG